MATATMAAPLTAKSRVTIAGKTLTKRVWDLLADARRAAGLPAGAASVTQGAYNKGRVAASAGTHDGAGVFDVSLAGLTEAQQIRFAVEIRRRNGCFWIRSKKYGWNGAVHGHGVIRDEPGLSPAAAKQVKNYDAGNNSLAGASRQPDKLPRPKQYSMEEVRKMTVVTPAPYQMLKRSTDQVIPLNEWVKLDIDDNRDWVLPPVGGDDWDAYVNLDLSSVKGATRNDLRYIVGRWARHDAKSPDANADGLDVTGADTKAISPDLPKKFWRGTWTHGFKGQAGIPVSFWVYIGSMVNGTVVSPLRIFKVDDEA